ncbi:hypothetical protein GHK39_20575 [Sinorhizobium medicae]|nr:hypothetical protein [Sinorhizobium medicae]MQV90269.1 hypothetical protein [Sinorhizobium medicae]
MDPAIEMAELKLPLRLERLEYDGSPPELSGAGILVHASVVRSHASCPKCRGARSSRYGYMTMICGDAPFHGRSVKIKIRAGRFRCASCRHVYRASLPGLDGKRRMTTRLVEYIREQVPLQGISAVASNAGLDEKTVRNVYNELSQAYLNHRIDPKLKHLGIVRYRDGRLSASVILDLVERSVVDVVNGTRARDLERWLLAVPHRETIKSVIMDPLRSYRRAVANAVPDAHIVTVPSLFDHIIAHHIHGNIIKKLPVRRSSGLRLWFASEPGQSIRVKRMREVIDARNPRVARAWRAKEGFKEIDNAPTVAEANQRLDKWLMEMPEDILRSSKTLVREILEWREPLTFLDNEFRDVAVQLRKRLLWHVGRNGRPRNFNQIASRAKSSGYALDERLRTCGCCLKVSRMDHDRGLAFEHIIPAVPVRGHHNMLDRSIIICARCHSSFDDRNAGMAV